MAVVQASSLASAVGTSTSVTLTGVTAGNALVAMVGVNHYTLTWDLTDITVTDSASNSYGQDAAVQISSSYCGALVFSTAAGSSGSVTVTVHAANAVFLELVVVEVSGTTALDQTGTATDTLTDHVTVTAAGATTAAAEYVASIATTDAPGNPTTIATPSGFTSRGFQSDGDDFLVTRACDKVLSATGTPSAVFSASGSGSHNWAAVLATYKAAVALPTVTAAGDSAAAFAGGSLATGVMTAPAGASAAFTGGSAVTGVLAASGSSSAAFAGGSLATATLTAGASSSASFTPPFSTLAASGDSDAAWVGFGSAGALLSAPGDSSALWAGVPVAAGVFSASAASAALFSPPSSAFTAAAESSAAFAGLAVASGSFAGAGSSSAAFAPVVSVVAVFTAAGSAAAAFTPPLFDQSAVRDVFAAVSGADLRVRWSSSAPPGTTFQVYVDRTLAWHGTGRSAVLPHPSGPVRIEVGVVAPGDAGANFAADLPLPSAGGSRVKLEWLGGRYEGPDTLGFHVYGGASPGGAVDYAAPLDTIAAYPQNIINDGWGVGGWGSGGWGSSAGTYSWTSGALGAGTWNFGVKAFDSAGNESSPITWAVTIAGPPQPVARNTDGRRLTYTSRHVAPGGWGAGGWGSGGWGGSAAGTGLAVTLNWLPSSGA